MHATARRFRLMRRISGFTLVEMLVVITIIGILAAAVLGLYAQAKKITWKQQTRNIARQLAQAWKMRLQEDQAWPDQTRFDADPGGNMKIVPPGDFQFATTSNNMAVLNYNVNGTTNTFFELNAAQQQNGFVDHWGHLFLIRLDFDNDGKIANPDDESKVIYSSVIVYSTGPNIANKKDWVVSF